MSAEDVSPSSIKYVPENENQRRMMLAHYLLDTCEYEYNVGDCYKNILPDLPDNWEKKTKWTEVPLLVEVGGIAKIFPVLLGLTFVSHIHIESGWLSENTKKIVSQILRQVGGVSAGFILLARAKYPKAVIDGPSLGLPLALAAKMLLNGGKYPTGVFATGNLNRNNKIGKIGYLEDKYNISISYNKFSMFIYPAENNNDISGLNTSKAIGVNTLNGALALCSLIPHCRGQENILAKVDSWRDNPSDFFLWLLKYSNSIPETVINGLGDIAEVEDWGHNFKDEADRLTAITNLERCSFDEKLRERFYYIIEPGAKSGDKYIEYEELYTCVPKITLSNDTVDSTDIKSIYDHPITIINNFNCDMRSSYIEDKIMVESIFETLSIQDKRKYIFLWGEGGIGKTTLAKRIINILIERMNKQYVKYKDYYFDIIIWISDSNAILNVDEYIKGKTTVTLDSILNEILNAIKESNCATIDDKKSKVLDFLKDKRLLLILDNYETINDVDIKLFLENYISSPHKVLITSRISRYFNLHDVYLYHVEGIEPNLQVGLIKSLLPNNYHSEEDIDLIISKEGKNPKGIELSCALMLRYGINAKEFYSSSEYWQTNDRFEYYYRLAFDQINNKEKFLLKLFLITEYEIPKQIFDFIFRKSVIKQLNNLESLCLINKNNKTDCYSIDQKAREIWPEQLLPSRKNNNTNLQEVLSIWLAKHILTYIAKESGDSDWSPPHILKMYSKLHIAAKWATNKYISKHITPKICEYIVKAAHNASFRGYSRSCIDDYLEPLLLSNTARKVIGVREKAIILRQLMWDYYLVNDFKNSRIRCDELICLVNGLDGYNIYVADAFRIIGMIEKRHKNVDSAATYLDNALGMLRDDKSIQARQLVAAIYQIYANIEDSKIAKLNQFQVAVNEAIQLPNSDPFISLVYQKMAKTYLSLKRYDKFLHFLDLAEEKSVDRERGKAYDSYYRALYYEEINDINKAIEYIKDSKDKFISMYDNRANDDYERIQNKYNQLNTTSNEENINE